MTRVFQSLATVAIVIGGFGESRTEAVTIDDFTVGPFTFTGPAGPFDQVGLNTSHVIGGGRRTQITIFASHLDINTSLGQMDFDSGVDRGYLTLTYGALAPLNADLTAGGHDRIRLKLTDVVAVSPLLANFSVRDTANVARGFNLDGALTALNGGGGVIELLYGAGTTNFASIANISLSLTRYTPNGTLVIDDIVTAGAPLPGDYNRDGLVDTGDYNEWRRLFGKSTLGVLLGADGNGNGIVDAADFTIWRDHLGTAGGGSGGLQSVPEPSAGRFAICVAIGACWLVRLSARRDG